MSKKNKQAKVTTKQFSLTGEEVSEIIYIAGERRARMLEMQFWGLQLEAKQQEILKRNGVSFEDSDVDWKQIVSTGKVFVTPRPRATVQMGGEEKKPDEQTPPTKESNQEIIPS